MITCTFFLLERVHVWHYYIYMKYGMMNDFVCGSATDTNIHISKRVSEYVSRQYEFG